MINFEKRPLFVEAVGTVFFMYLHGFCQCLPALWKYGGIILILDVCAGVYLRTRTHTHKESGKCLHASI